MHFEKALIISAVYNCFGQTVHQTYFETNSDCLNSCNLLEASNHKGAVLQFYDKNNQCLRQKRFF